MSEGVGGETMLLRGGCGRNNIIYSDKGQLLAMEEGEYNR